MFPTGRSQRQSSVSHPAIVHTELLLLALVTGSLAVTWVCRRFDISAPLVLVVVGIAASFIPGVETVQFDPDIVLFAVLTPLLYSAALESSFLGIRQNLRPIGLLAVGLPVFSAFAVGLVAWWVVPGLTLPAALVLGAVVAPPDAVSALSIGRRLGLPRRLMTIIGGESLVNDATALTLFRVFIAVAVGAGISILEGFGMFLLAAVGGTAIGLAIGWLVHKIRTHLDDSDVESALGLIVPFATYLVAELAHTSGVLAVVVAGLYLGYKAPESGYATRLQEQAVWRAADTILESVVFALIGLQLTSVVAAAGDIRPLLVAGVVVTLAAVIARIVWVFPATYIPRLLIPAIGRRDPAPSWRVPAVISWSGMRGVVTLAAAFAIPADRAGSGDDRVPGVLRDGRDTAAARPDAAHGDPAPRRARDGFQADVLAEAQAQYDAVQASIARLDELTAESDTYLNHTAEKLRRLAECGPTRCGSSWGAPTRRPGRARARPTDGCAGRCSTANARRSWPAATPATSTTRSSAACCASSTSRRPCWPATTTDSRAPGRAVRRSAHRVARSAWLFAQVRDVCAGRAGRAAAGRRMVLSGRGTPRAASSRRRALLVREVPDPGEHLHRVRAPAHRADAAAVRASRHGSSAPCTLQHRHLRQAGLRRRRTGGRRPATASAAPTGSTPSRSAPLRGCAPPLRQRATASRKSSVAAHSAPAHPRMNRSTPAPCRATPARATAAPGIPPRPRAPGPDREVPGQRPGGPPAGAAQPRRPASSPAAGAAPRPSSRSAHPSRARRSRRGPPRARGSARRRPRPASRGRSRAAACRSRRSHAGRRPRRGNPRSASADELVSPRVPELGETVQEDHERPVTALDDVQPDPVGGDRAVGPRARVADRRRSRVAPRDRTRVSGGVAVPVQLGRSAPGRPRWVSTCADSFSDAIVRSGLRILRTRR